MPDTGKTSWTVQRLSGTHDRASFDCGKLPLNEWLVRFAGQYERRDLARTYVAIRPGEQQVLGYYAISSHLIRYDSLPDEQAKGLPTIDIPVVLLGRLAVDRHVQGQGLGEHLLMDAFRRADYVAQQIGIRAAEVHALDDDARRFYVKFGFMPLLDDPEHLFIPMQVVRKLRLPPL